MNLTGQVCGPRWTPSPGRPKNPDLSPYGAARLAFYVSKSQPLVLGSEPMKTDHLRQGVSVYCERNGIKQMGVLHTKGLREIKPFAVRFLSQRG